MHDHECASPHRFLMSRNSAPLGKRARVRFAVLLALSACNRDAAAVASGSADSTGGTGSEGTGAMTSTSMPGTSSSTLSSADSSGSDDGTTTIGGDGGGGPGRAVTPTRQRGVQRPPDCAEAHTHFSSTFFSFFPTSCVLRLARTRPARRTLARVPTPRDDAAAARGLRARGGLWAADERWQRRLGRRERRDRGWGRLERVADGCDEHGRRVGHGGLIRGGQ